MSWHVNRDGKSFIDSLLALSDKYEIEIHMESEKTFLCFEKDDFVIGDGTILINHKTEDNKLYVDLINADKIESISLIGEENISNDEEE